MKPLAITERALTGLLSQALPNSFFSEPSRLTLSGLVVVENEHSINIITPACYVGARFLAIHRAPDGFFEAVAADERRQVFDKCARVALRAFGDPVRLNPRWMSYHSKSRVSIYAYSERLTSERLLFDVNAEGTQNVYAAQIAPASESMDLEGINIDYGPFSAANRGLAAALDAPPSSADEVIAGSIELTDMPPADFAGRLTFSEWFPRNLSAQQRAFVELDVTGPLRLRGAAGTGKTLAMAIKVIKLLYDAADERGTCRVLFATHSWAGAEMVDQVLRRIDERALLVSPPPGISLDVYPLLTLAEENRDYAAIGRRPLGIDSAEGKRLSLEKINEIVNAFCNNEWIAYRSGVTADFREKVESPSDSSTRRRFCWDVLIEFGCVLAAQGILTSSSERQRYLRMKRSKWMMSLESEVERQAVFALWIAFLAALREDRLIASDQMISDYLNYLGTFFWDAARQGQGYDYVFVDEMHLFNHQERLVFHNLLSDAEAAPKVVMALDPRQSPRETFAQVKDEETPQTGNIYAQARLPNPVRIDFSDVFRYTPQIERVIRCVNENAPALDLPDDWNIPVGASKMPAGATPECWLTKGQLGTFRLAIDKGKELVRSLSASKERVAILCLDDFKFQSYASAARVQCPNDVVVIASRDDTERLRYSGKRAVFSTPEYVAGLQFAAVILVDANKDLVPEKSNSSLELRRHLSELYLGISRAQRLLYIVADEEAGGLSDSLKRCVKEGSLSLM